MLIVVLFQDARMVKGRKLLLKKEDTYRVHPESCKLISQEHDTVYWTYRGYLSTGIIFDQGKYRAQLGHHQVITGVDVGMRGLCVGDRRTLTIQPEWGYGPRGFPGKIPPNSVLMFDVELMGIERPNGPKSYIGDLKKKAYAVEDKIMHLKETKTWRRLHPAF